jgi:hypothetical protein
MLVNVDRLEADLRGATMQRTIFVNLRGVFTGKQCLNRWEQ